MAHDAASDFRLSDSSSTSRDEHIAMNPGRWAQLVRPTVQFAVGSAAIAVMSLAGFVFQASAVAMAVFYFFVVFAVALWARVVPALLVSLVAIVCLDFFFTQPAFSLDMRLSSPVEVVAVIAFAAAALIGPPVIASARRSFAYDEKLRAELQLTIDVMPTMIWIRLPDGTNEFVNRTWLNYTGLSVQEARGFGWQSVIHPDQRARAISGWRAAATTDKPFEQELRIKRADGTYRWVLSRAIPVYGEEGKKWYGASTDIEDRKHAEQALERSERRYALAIEGTRAGHWDWVIATDEYYASPRMLEIFGLSPASTFAGRADFFARAPLHPEDRSRYEEAITTHIASASTRFEDEVRIVPGGQTRWIHVIGLLSRDGSGAVVRWTGSVVDITDRKVADEALSLSEERYSRAMEGSDAGHWDWDIRTDEIFISARAKVLMGLEGKALPSTRSEVMSQVQMPAGDFQRMMDEGVQASLMSGQHRRDYRVLTESNEVRWLRSRGKVFFDHTGQPVRLTGSLTDITESKLAEEALRVSEERFALALAGSNEGIFDWDLATDQVFMSERAQSLIGLQPGEPWQPRAKWSTAVEHHPDDLILQRTGIRKHLDGETPAYDVEFRLRFPGSETRWFRQRGVALRDGQGKPYRMAGSIEDITDRKTAEEELLRRQDMLDLAQKAARAVAFEWRIGIGEGQNRWSPELEGLYGLAPGTYDGTFDSWRKLVYAEDWPLVKQALEHATDTGEVAAEYRVVHDGGAMRWLQAKGRMLFDAAGAPARMVGFMLDVTERHQAEEELQRLEKQLRQSQRLEAMGTLAGGIAHDFNNILGAILGYGEMALRGVPKENRLRRDLNSIITAGERGRALVERILAFSRSGVNDRVAVHVEAEVGEALDLAAGSLQGVAVERSLRAGRAAVLGDPTQIHQVVMNLVTNAVHAMVGGGTLKVGLATLQLDTQHVTTTGQLDAGEYVVLTVTDSGVGIPSDILERIFDPFFTTKEVGIGTGLGLSLVHGIVTGLDGAVDVASEVGAGSTFTVYLPRAGNAINKSAQEEAESRELPRGNRQQVMVIDDDEALARLTGETLTRLGYRPVTFASSAAALKAFQSAPDRFNAVVTDERMPAMSGTALIEALRIVRPFIPILLVTGYAGAAVVRRARDAGASEVLGKPVSARQLATAMDHMLQQQRQSADA